MWGRESAAGLVATFGESMQKLEQVSRAEEAARKAVSKAKDDAEKVLAEADRYAREHLDSIRAAVSGDVEALKTQRCKEAEAEASRVTEEISKTVEAELTSARARIESAASAALERLVG